MIAIDLIGAVALLLWGLHMVQTGVMRACGTKMRSLLAAALSSRFKAFLAGATVTALLQSSTATTLMATSFARGGLISLVPALAIVLGANVGTALIVQVLSFDVSLVAPVLLVLGVAAFKLGRRARTRDLGRVAIGMGLMLLALRSLTNSLGAAEHAPFFETLLPIATASPLLCIIIAAVLSWLAHSSIAVVALVMLLASAHAITPASSIALVAGANLGSAINPLWASGQVGDAASYRIPIGNLVNRIIGCTIVLALLGRLANVFANLEHAPARMAADFHLAFNVALAVAFILPLPAIARILTNLLPERRPSPDPSTPLYLDEGAIATPGVALACAQRETLRIGDMVETMLEQTMTALLQNDRDLVDTISRMDNAVDRLNEAVKLYVTQVTQQALDPREAKQAMAIVFFNTNLEHVGDIIDKSLLELAAKKIRKKLRFSKEGGLELEAFHRDVIANFKLAFTVFISGDIAIARKLLKDKDRLRLAERAAAENHLERLRSGRLESLETSSLHFDVLRDLRRVHSHICSVAHLALEAPEDLVRRQVTLESSPDVLQGGCL